MTLRNSAARIRELVPRTKIVWLTASGNVYLDQGKLSGAAEGLLPHRLWIWR